MMLNPKITVSALALAVSQAALAGTEPYFNPLTQSAAVASPNHINELNSPWQAPAGVSQKSLTSMAEVEADSFQSIQRVDFDGLGNPAGSSASMFDMLAYSPGGRYIFIPHESPVGAGITRYDRRNDFAELIFAGDENGDRSDPNGPTWDYDYGAFDPARMTPNGTVIAGEEWSGRGRIVEVMNPLGPAPADPTAGSATMEYGVDYRELHSIARVSHEGINFSIEQKNEVIYYVDEDRSGSVYKLVLATKGDYATGGQTFVLATDGYMGTVDERWDGSGSDDSVVNQSEEVQASRFGMATWVPLTDETGTPLEGIRSPFESGEDGSTRPGRDAADDAGGTPFGRPEDMTIGYSADGNEMLYVATTSENAVISIEELGDGKAMVRQFASTATARNAGFPATTGVLNAPDNLAQDALGNIFIIEDSPNSSDVGGDIWFARDTDGDGIAESLDHFLSLQVDGSEATGMIFHPRKPGRFVVAVQHPDSTNLAEVPEGFGDAIWEFNLRGVVPPVCAKKEGFSAYQYMSFDMGGGQEVQTCTYTDDVNFNRKLRQANRDRSPFQP